MTDLMEEVRRVEALSLPVEKLGKSLICLAAEAAALGHRAAAVNLLVRVPEAYFDLGHFEDQVASDGLFAQLNLDLARVLVEQRPAASA